jgi:hypothetical protein
MPGQQTTRSKGRRRALLAALRKGHGYSSAAIACKVSPSFFREWRHDDVAFRAECAEAVDFRDDVAEHTLYQRGLQGDTLALLAWLRAHRPELYHRKLLVGVGGDPDAPPVVTAEVTGAMIYPRPELLRELDNATVADGVIDGEVLDAEDTAA